MTNLEKKAEAFQINSQQELEKYYSENVKELSTCTNRNVTISGVIEDYKKALALLKNKNINIKDNFNRELFNQILAKIKAIGITNWQTEMPELKLYRNYLIEEASKKDKQAAQSFSNMLSDDYIKNTGKEILQLFYQAFSHYVEISVNLHQYTKTTIITNNRIGNSCFEDLKSKYRDEKIIKDIDNIKNFLNAMIEEISG